MFNTSGIITMYIRDDSGGIVANVAQVMERLNVEKIKNSLQKWYPEHSKKGFIQTDDYLESDMRPFITLSAKSIFATLEEYMIIYGFDMIQEVEHVTSFAKTVLDGTINLRMMTLKNEGSRCYFEFIVSS